MHPLTILALLTFCVALTAHAAPPCYDPATYPDEAALQARLKPTIPALAAQKVGDKLLATSTCPKCGNHNAAPVLVGETVTCPKCGQTYPQPEGSYFGPAARDKDGRITHYKGDPLKYELQQVAAKLLLDPNDQAARNYVSSPGALRQQYHFACVNWARFYPLLADKMGDAWKKDFAHFVAIYKEDRRPSDETKHLAKPEEHNLVGTPGELLGGGVADGGTENHKTMWRTSGLLYSQLLPLGPAGKDARISNIPAAEAEKLITTMLADYQRKCFTDGNGEWQSATYYPYSIRGFMNLYDFSPSPDTRALARAQLDYYFASYGLHLINATYAGPEKRGFVNAAPFTPGAKHDTPDEMVALFTNAISQSPDPSISQSPITSLHLATTRYRPNRVLMNLLTKKIPLPFEAQISHPSYHIKDRNAAQEYLYVTDQYAMGSVYLAALDNPTQQTVWSLAIKNGPNTTIIGGGQPKYRSPEGHSPYTQTMQHKGTLIVMSANTVVPEGEMTAEQAQRAKEAPALVPADLPLNPTVQDILEFWNAAPRSAATWLYIPRNAAIADRPFQTPSGLQFAVIQAGKTWVAAIPLTGKFFRFQVPATLNAKMTPEQAKQWQDMESHLAKYTILVCAGPTAGFVLETATTTQYPTQDAFVAAISKSTRLDNRRLADGLVSFVTPGLEYLEMHYNPTGLRCTGTIEGKPLDFAHWANNGHIDSPYLKVKAGLMRISDGKEAYEIDTTTPIPTFREAKP